MAKSHSRRVAAQPAKIKTSVTLSPEAFLRLGAAVVKEGMSQSELVEWMIDRLLSGYTVRVVGERIGRAADRERRAASSREEDRPGDDGGINSPALSAA